jgi:predicted Zn-dependent peptidase
VQCAPEELDHVTGEIDKILSAFATDGPTDEEIENARKQVVNNLDTQMKEPRYWLRELQYADLHKLDLNVLKNLKETYAEYPGEKVKATFDKYFTPARQFSVSAFPAKAPAPAEAADAEVEATTP